MKLYNAKHLCDQAAAKGFGIPALNNNGGSYDIGRAIIEACEELHSPLIIQCYEPNLEYRGFDYAGQLIRFLAADTHHPDGHRAGPRENPGVGHARGQGRLHARDD